MLHQFVKAYQKNQRIICILHNLSIILFYHSDIYYNICNLFQSFRKPQMEKVIMSNKNNGILTSYPYCYRPAQTVEYMARITVWFCALHQIGQCNALGFSTCKHFRILPQVRFIKSCLLWNTTWRKFRSMILLLSMYSYEIIPRFLFRNRGIHQLLKQSESSCSVVIVIILFFVNFVIILTSKWMWYF